MTSEHLPTVIESSDDRYGSHARELLKALLGTNNLMQLPEDGTQGETAGICAIEALEELEELERKGWQFIPPPPDPRPLDA